MRHLILLALFATGCVRSQQFHCEESAECGTGATCEPDGLCSVASSNCSSGREYAPSSGKEGTCVGGEPGEAGNNEMPGEAGAEPLPMGCRADYMALPNSGPRGHRYLPVNTAAAWQTQFNFCATNMGFLAFPDGTNTANAQLELDAIKVAIGDGAWVGVSDFVTEGQLRNTLNMPASTATQSLVNLTGNPNPDDCLYISGTTLDDESCGQSRKVMCECVP